MEIIHFLNEELCRWHLGMTRGAARVVHSPCRTTHATDGRGRRMGTTCLACRSLAVPTTGPIVGPLALVVLPGLPSTAPLFSWHAPAGLALAPKLIAYLLPSASSWLPCSVTGGPAGAV